MIKIIQFGEGNFLRSFVDLYFQQLNDEGGNYSVSIIKPRAHGSLSLFREQRNHYHVVQRGVRKNCLVEEVYPVSVVENIFSSGENVDAILALAQDPDVKIVVSNTTEAGICFCANDRFEDFSTMSYPGKLTRLLLARYEANLPGVYLLPTELIDNNAQELFRCVNAYIRLWQLPEEFTEWNQTQNYYCNTLVDRIVSGYPKDPSTLSHIETLVARKDRLLSVAEPFGLWAIEDKGDISSLLPAGQHNIEVVLSKDISFFKRRKVRILNGSHTNMVALGVVLGKETVYDCMTSEDICRFFRSSLEEIIPFVSEDKNLSCAYAYDVEQRFRNPFLNHKLNSIVLNSISKWKARVLPSFRDFYTANGTIPPHLTIGFSYLMHLYQTQAASLQDLPEYLEWFASGFSIADFMASQSIWGEDLTAYPDFLQTVEHNLRLIKEGNILL